MKRQSPLPLLAFGLVLSAATLARAEQAAPLAPSPPPSTRTEGGPRWGISLGAGFAAGAFLDSSLNRQIVNAGYLGGGPGFHFRSPLEFDVRLLSFLALGLAVDAQFGSFSRERDGLSQGFHTLNALFLLRPSVQFWNQGNGDGAILGIDLGAGGGTALWVLRGEASAAPAYRLRTNLVVSYVRRGIGAGFRIGALYAGAGPFGPRGLAMRDWSSFVEPRLEWRW